jgi:hypothetical protein
MKPVTRCVQGFDFRLEPLLRTGPGMDLMPGAGSVSRAKLTLRPIIFNCSCCAFSEDLEFVTPGEVLRTLGGEGKLARCVYR